MKIGIDIDDTVIGFYEDFAKFLNKKYSKNLTSSYVGKNFLNLFNTKEQVFLEVKEFVKKGLSYELAFFEDFEEVFKELNNSFDLIFITSRSFDERAKTRDFFKKKGFELDIHYVHDYPEPKKSLVCKRLGVDFLIDDDKKNALDCANNGVKVFLLKKSWNDDCEDHPNIIKIGDWYQVRDFLKNNKKLK